MRWIKRILLGLTLLVLASFVGLWWYLQSLPTMGPRYISALPSNSTITEQCLQQHPAFAYQVQAQLTTKTAEHLIHQTQLSFAVQFAARGEDSLAAMASRILVDDSQQGEQSLADIPFVASAQGQQQLNYQALNSLGLPSQHPMRVLSQLLKNLSVGQEGQVYRYAYDEMQCIYRYQNSAGWQRTVSVLGQLNSSGLQPIWDIEMEDCLPKSMHSKEIQPLTIANEKAGLEVALQVQRIDNFMDLAQLNFSADANAQRQWQVALLDPQRALKEISSDDDAWQRIASFAVSKDVASLMQAAQYLVDNKNAGALARDILTQDDTLNRDLLFAMGLLKTPESADYLLNLIEQMPSGSNHAELQEVRAMVALSGHEASSTNSFYGLQQLQQNSIESVNTRANALINMGSMLQNMENRGQSEPALRSELSQVVSQRLQSNESASAAIFSAGNLGLEKTDPQIKSSIVNKLGQGNQKDRFAAATVLSRDLANYSLLKQQYSQERSDLVKQSIVDGLKQAGASAQQLSDLQQ